MNGRQTMEGRKLSAKQFVKAAFDFLKEVMTNDNTKQRLLDDLKQCPIQNFNKMQPESCREAGCQFQGNDCHCFAFAQGLKLLQMINQ